MSEMYHVHNVVGKVDMIIEMTGWPMIADYSQDRTWTVLIFIFVTPEWKSNSWFTSAMFMCVGFVCVGGGGEGVSGKRGGEAVKITGRPDTTISQGLKGPPFCTPPLPPFPLLFFLTNNAKSWQPTQRHEQQFPIRDRQPSYRLGTSHVCRTTATVRREQTGMGVFQGKEKYISMPSWSGCGESASLNQQKEPKWRYQRQILVMELVPGFHKYPLPPATRQGLHLFEVGTTLYVLTRNAIRLCKSM